MKFIDLFAGIGGFHLALSRLGHECVFASEIKPRLRKIYKQNFPNTPIEGDITKIEVEDIPSHDILCGGFPCQPFSFAGKKLGFEDEKGRGNLFLEICRVLEYHKPIYIFLENVSALPGHDDGRTWKVIQQKLDELGYDIKSKVISPHEFGIPQHRPRFYIVGKRRDADIICLDRFKFPKINRKNKINPIIILAISISTAASLLGLCSGWAGDEGSFPETRLVTLPSADGAEVTSGASVTASVVSSS